MQMETRELSRSKPARRRGGDAGQTRRRLRLVLLFVSMIVLADALVGERGLIESYRAQREYAALEAQIQALRAENATLRTEAVRLRTDPETIERVARHDLGLIRPGELVVLVNADAVTRHRGRSTVVRH
jgi:cell division protein FtsB